MAGPSAQGGLPGTRLTKKREERRLPDTCSTAPRSSKHSESSSSPLDLVCAWGYSEPALGLRGFQTKPRTTGGGLLQRAGCVGAGFVRLVLHVRLTRVSGTASKRSLYR